MASDYRSESRKRWARQATGWSRRADHLRDATMPVTTAMIEALAPQPGDDVLELAAGIGDVGFMVAEMIKPGGTLICSDFAPEMLTSAQQRARELGLDNVRFRQIDAESMDQPAASLDGVLCRWGYMLMVDPEAALRQTRRVLKSGGRLSLAAWTGPDDNPWSSLPQRELLARGLTEPAEEGAPGQFAWADPALIEDVLHAAGFVEFGIERVDFAIRYDDFEHWWQTQLDLSSSFAGAVRAAEPDDAEAMRGAVRGAAEGFVQTDGSLQMPAASWVVAAVA